MSLALHRDVGGHRHRPERVDVDGDHRDRAVLGPRLVARLRREQGGEIPHIGHAGFDHGGEPDSVMPPGGARGIPPALEVGEASVAGRGLDRAQIVAGIIERAGRRPVREFLRGDEIALDDLEMIELELDRDPLHQALERQVELRSAEAADQARRHLVRQHDAVGHVNVAGCRRRRLWHRACGRAVRAWARAGTRRNPRADRAAAPECGRPW